MRAVRLLMVLGGFLAACALSQAIGPLMLSRLGDANGTIDLMQPGAETGLVIATLAPLVVFVLVAALVVKLVYYRRPVDRVLLVLAGCLAAALVLPLLTVVLGAVLWVIGTTFAEPGQELPSLAGTLLYWVWIVIYFCGPIAYFSLIPALSILILAELKAIRSLLFYCLTGALVVPLGRYAYWLWLASPSGYWDLGLSGLPLLLVVGVLAGVAYWFVAGRNAGTLPLTASPAKSSGTAEAVDGSRR